MSVRVSVPVGPQQPPGLREQLREQPRQPRQPRQLLLRDQPQEPQEPQEPEEPEEPEPAARPRGPRSLCPKSAAQRSETIPKAQVGQHVGKVFVFLAKYVCPA